MKILPNLTSYKNKAMGIFIKRKLLRDAKAKDTVLNYLFAYGKLYSKGCAPFKKDKEYVSQGEGRDIEKAIESVNNEADYDYSKNIVTYLEKFDYIRKADIRHNDVFYYSLSDIGTLFVQTQGFEKNLKDEQRINSENFYKWITLGVALLAIILPIIYGLLQRHERCC